MQWVWPLAAQLKVSFDVSFLGGQAFVIKVRPTKERSSSSLLLEPPFGLNGSDVDYGLPPRWRHMKHACGSPVLADMVGDIANYHPR